MDYGAVLQRAWHETWRYKILWLFGFFVGGASASSSNNSANTGSVGAAPTAVTPASIDAAARVVRDFVIQNGALIVSLLVLVTAIGLLFLVISVAAQGALIHLVNEGEEGRPVRGGAGWRVGFTKWWRVFGVDFLTGLPILVLFAGMTAIGVVAVISAVDRVGGFVALATQGSAAVAAVLMSLLGVGLVEIVLLVVALVVGVILGIVREIAVRYAVLQEMRVVASLKAGWRDLWARRGAFLMWLILLGIGIAYAVVVGIIAAIFEVPAALGAGAVAGGLAGLVSLLLIIPSAAFAAFGYAAWTVFFRRMTGMERPAPAGSLGGGVPETPVPPAPVQPPAGPPAGPVPPAGPPAPVQPPAGA